MQYRPSFRPMPTPTTPGRLIRRPSCFRLTALTVAIVRSFNVSAGSLSACGPNSGRRRPDEPVLHERLRLLAGPADHLEGSLIQRIACLRLPSDPLLHRLEGHRRRFAREDIDLFHRRHDVRLVEALFLRDLREFLRGGDAHLVRDRARADVKGAAEDPGAT